MPTTEVPLPEAAHALGLSWSQAWRLLLQRKLKGRRDERGRWLIDGDSLADYQRALGAADAPQAA